MGHEYVGSNFEKKDDLFRALIDPMMGAYDSLYERAVALQCATKGDVRSGELAIMDFVMDHRDKFKLLFNCAQGSSYEGCKAALLEAHGRRARRGGEAGGAGLRRRYVSVGFLVPGREVLVLTEPPRHLRHQPGGLQR